MAVIAIKELEQLCRAALAKAGFRPQDAEIITAHFLENELSGKASHGMVRVVEAVKSAKKYGLSQTDPEIVIDKGNMAVLDARGQAGPVAGKFAMELAIQRAREHGLALTGVRNYIINSGSMAWYLRRFADAGLIALIGCNSVAQVAPPGGRKRLIGTNPVGIAIPGENGALIADLATSAMAYGKMMVLKDKGQPVPEGMLIDKDGNPSTDAADAFDGAILPLAGYKGFALGLMVELLAGPLLGARAIKEDLYNGDGFFMIAIDPEQLNPDFRQQVSETLGIIRNSPTQPSVDKITLPGDRSLETLNETRKRGEVNIVDKTLENLKAAAA